MHVVACCLWDFCTLASFFSLAQCSHELHSACRDVCQVIRCIALERGLCNVQLMELLRAFPKLKCLQNGMLALASPEPILNEVLLAYYQRGVKLLGHVCISKHTVYDIGKSVSYLHPVSSCLVDLSSQRFRHHAYKFDAFFNMNYACLHTLHIVCTHKPSLMRLHNLRVLETMSITFNTHELDDIAVCMQYWPRSIQNLSMINTANVLTHDACLAFANVCKTLSTCALKTLFMYNFLPSCMLECPSWNIVSRAALNLPVMDSLSFMGSIIPDIVMLSFMSVTRSLSCEINVDGSLIPIDLWGDAPLCTSLQCLELPLADFGTLMYFDSTRKHWDAPTQQLIAKAFECRRIDIEGVDSITYQAD